MKDPCSQANAVNMIAAGPCSCLWPAAAFSCFQEMRGGNKDTNISEVLHARFCSVLCAGQLYFVNVKLCQLRVR